MQCLPRLEINTFMPRIPIDSILLKNTPNFHIFSKISAKIKTTKSYSL